MQLNASTYAIDASMYLPAGNLRYNALPARCDSFIYLQIDADLSAISGGNPTKVFVPCYFDSGAAGPGEPDPDL
jgi:hypothetical protein